MEAETVASMEVTKVAPEEVKRVVALEEAETVVLEEDFVEVTQAVGDREERRVVENTHPEEREEVEEVGH